MMRFHTGPYYIQRISMTSDPPKVPRDGPSKDSDPADRHSGEGLASVRPRLARTLADSALRTIGRQPDAMTAPIAPEPAVPVQPKPCP